ncbi:MAG: phosphoribosylaminoimidazolesuccinocarboxamide synthase [Flavobacteriales bacterium]|jgi:phosphoribosylaminoimidazole-succinocarboxamide synthase|nr:phosphoribosylaminoimidazolesuccinocarboxamide synthase [Flavobacteriales bacterium]
MKALTSHTFEFKNQTNFYRGKVRDVYSLDNDQVIMIASDRLSAFDVVMPKGIPFKGQILNQIASKFLKMTEEVCPNWLMDNPDPNISVGTACTVFKVEMVIRGYLAGHAWREYKAGKRILCGVALPEGLKENDRLPNPIITPSTKADNGEHDMDISREEILSQGIVSEEDYLILEDYTRRLFQKGTEYAQSRGLILVDTKYEFGKDKEGTIRLIDEIHTPDSSRYFYAEGYDERQNQNEKQKQLSKEFVRQWLIENGFQGKTGQEIPEMNDAKIEEISNRYIELYEQLMGENFVKADVEDIQGRILKNMKMYL